MNIVSLNPHLAARSNEQSVSRSQLEVAAEQFEALFLQQLLKQMRKAGDVLSNGSPMRSRDLDTLRDMHDQALADGLSQSRQGGIADLLVKQLSAGRDQALADGGRGPAPGPVGGGGFAIPLQRAWGQVSERVDRLFSQGSAAFQSLVDRVITQESGGRVDAVSVKGARGIMQLMPDTAREMAGRLGIAYDEARLTQDADYNKRLGSAYLQQMLERYDGHQVLALAAYNAGPGNVDEWLKSYGDPREGAISNGEWIKRIPFEETRTYTRRILTEPLAAQTVPSVLSPAEAFKSSAPAVALQEQRQVSVAGEGHRGLSLAFAQPIRTERQEQQP